MTRIVDVLVIGGGPAGLATALTLSRQLHSCIVFDSGEYRNSSSHHMHMTPTWDHQNPKDFRAAARKNITDKYSTVEFQDVKVTEVSKTEDGLFKASADAGSHWIGRKLVLACGVKDLYPDIKGYADCWGKGIFHCLFCHGYEQRDAPSSAVLAVGLLEQPPMALHVGRNALQLTPSGVTIYTNGNEKATEAMNAAMPPNSRFKLDARKISSLSNGKEEGQVVFHFEDGSEITEGFVAHVPNNTPSGPFAAQLGLELSPSGFDIKTNPPFNETSLSGVFAAGDAGSPMKFTNMALSSACLVGSGIAAQLQAAGLGRAAPNDQKI